MTPDDVCVRFWEYIRRPPDCWVWQGPCNANGYGTTKVRHGSGWKTALAHRVTFGLRHGHLSPSLFMDHLCRNPACVNPDHLEAVTPRENAVRGIGPTGANAKKTHCVNGHPFDDENTYRRVQGKGKHTGRMCKQCGRDRQRLKASVKLG